MKNEGRVLTTDAEIRAAVREARKMPDEPFLKAIRYISDANALELTMSDGRRHLIPRERVQGLEGATKKAVGHIEIWAPGTGVYWPDLHVSLSVDRLIDGVYGTRKWMAELARRAGSVTSAKKARSSQLNGRKGGRPSKTTQTRGAANQGDKKNLTRGR